MVTMDDVASRAGVSTWGLMILIGQTFSCRA